MAASKALGDDNHHNAEDCGMANDKTPHRHLSDSSRELTVEEIDDDDPTFRASGRIYYPYELEEPEDNDAMNDAMSDVSCTILSSDETLAEADSDHVVRRLSQLQYDSSAEPSTPLKSPSSHLPRSLGNWGRKKRRRSTGESLTSEKLQRRESKTVVRKRAKWDVAQSLATDIALPLEEVVMTDIDHDKGTQSLT